MFDINVRMKTHVHKEKKVQVFDLHTHILTQENRRTHLICLCLPAAELVSTMLLGSSD